MEDERNTQYNHQEKADEQVEVKNRGLFDTLLGRKKAPEEEKKQEDLVTGMEKVTVAEPENAEVKKEEHEAGEKKESLFAKLNRTGSSSSSSSEEEEEVIDENGEVVKRKKKKGLKEKIQEKMPGHKDHEQQHEGQHKQESLVEKIKDKLPGHKDHDQETGEHKQESLVEKIKDKLPGHKDHDHDGAHKPYVPAPAPVETHVYHEGDYKPHVPTPLPTPVATHVHQEPEHKPYVPTPAPVPVVTHHHHEGEHKPYVPAPVATHDHHDVKTEAPPVPEEEKKGLLDKIKEKLPGGHKKPEDGAAAPAVHVPAPAPHAEDVSSPDGKEKKGILGKIMDKIPGYNKGAGEEDHKAAAAAGEHKTSY